MKFVPVPVPGITVPVYYEIPVTGGTKVVERKTITIIENAAVMMLKRWPMMFIFFI